ncbi:iso-IS1 ORF1 [Shigella sonnei]|nr:iso-IS1 ORF1 [Shigella sonnei]
MDRIRKDMPGFVAVTATASSSSLILMKPGVKEQITVMAFNGAGIRDTARTLKVGVNTVIRTLKNSHHDE